MVVQSELVRTVCNGGGHMKSSLLEFLTEQDPRLINEDEEDEMDENTYYEMFKEE